jgi:hypothetical protein
VRFRDAINARSGRPDDRSAPKQQPNATSRCVALQSSADQRPGASLVAEALVRPWLGGAIALRKCDRAAVQRRLGGAAVLPGGSGGVSLPSTSMLLARSDTFQVSGVSAEMPALLSPSGWLVCGVHYHASLSTGESALPAACLVSPGTALGFPSSVRQHQGADRTGLRQLLLTAGKRRHAALVRERVESTSPGH